MPVEPLQRVIRRALLEALALTSGNQAQAARLLGISSRSMNYQMQKHGIPRARTGWDVIHPRRLTLVS